MFAGRSADSQWHRPTPIDRDRIIEGMLQGLPHDERRERIRCEMSGTDPAAVLQATRSLIRFSSHDWASEIDVPTAVLIMTRDRIVPPKRQYKLAASIPRAKVYEVNADHLACVRAVDQFVPALVAACEYVSTESGIAG